MIEKHLKLKTMNLESVKQELEKNEIYPVESDSEYYWDDESIVFEYQGEHMLVYVSEDNLTYYFYTREVDEDLMEEEGCTEEEAMVNCTSHYGDASSVEEMLMDLGI